ncbi:hypothetical protein MTO98_17275 [Mucilaginibacter sp. SMC90]|uniref:hypothetical protein n=1 Tax=Mucilaginibacter sp. SMC90 TaxID=2929803 RepID=UPI001FB55967|nr:hypothetical protein [Mucilaginibacter sp. SMC90]UOE52822.1 hypothetical protein MTO98_17275 [Mucilaginibacter sp. SMC90]
MLLAAFYLYPSQANGYISSALLLLIPWSLFAIFGGMGRPGQYIGLACYSTNAVSALYNTYGVRRLRLPWLRPFRRKIAKSGEVIYSVLGFALLTIALLTIALPLFLVNMAFWGYYLPVAFKEFQLTPASPRPDWYLALRALFYVIAVAEVTLIYLAILFFAVAMKMRGYLPLFPVIGTLALV